MQKKTSTEDVIEIHPSDEETLLQHGEEEVRTQGEPDIRDPNVMAEGKQLEVNLHATAQKTIQNVATTDTNIKEASASLEAINHGVKGSTGNQADANLRNNILQLKKSQAVDQRNYQIMLRAAVGLKKNRQLQNAYQKEFAQKYFQVKDKPEMVSKLEAEYRSRTREAAYQRAQIKKKMEHAIQNPGVSFDVGVKVSTSDVKNLHHKIKEEAGNPELVVAGLDDNMFDAAPVKSGLSASLQGAANLTGGLLGAGLNGFVQGGAQIGNTAAPQTGMGFGAPGMGNTMGGFGAPGMGQPLFGGGMFGPQQNMGYGMAPTQGYFGPREDPLRKEIKDAVDEYLEEKEDKDSSDDDKDKKDDSKKKSDKSSGGKKKGASSSKGAKIEAKGEVKAEAKPAAASANAKGEIKAEVKTAHGGNAEIRRGDFSHVVSDSMHGAAEHVRKGEDALKAAATNVTRPLASGGRGVSFSAHAGVDAELRLSGGEVSDSDTRSGLASGATDMSAMGNAPTATTTMHGAAPGAPIMGVPGLAAGAGAGIAPSENSSASKGKHASSDIRPAFTVDTSRTSNEGRHHKIVDTIADREEDSPLDGYTPDERIALKYLGRIVEQQITANEGSFATAVALYETRDGIVPVFATDAGLSYMSMGAKLPDGMFALSNMVDNFGYIKSWYGVRRPALKLQELPKVAPALKLITLASTSGEKGAVLLDQSLFTKMKGSYLLEDSEISYPADKEFVDIFQERLDNVEASPALDNYKIVLEKAVDTPGESVSKEYLNALEGLMCSSLKKVLEEGLPSESRLNAVARELDLLRRVASDDEK